MSRTIILGIIFVNLLLVGCVTTTTTKNGEISPKSTSPKSKLTDEDIWAKVDAIQEERTIDREIFYGFKFGEIPNIEEKYYLGLSAEPESGLPMKVYKDPKGVFDKISLIVMPDTQVLCAIQLTKNHQMAKNSSTFFRMVKEELDKSYPIKYAEWMGDDRRVFYTLRFINNIEGWRKAAFRYFDKERKPYPRLLTSMDKSEFHYCYNPILTKLFLAKADIGESHVVMIEYESNIFSKYMRAKSEDIKQKIEGL